MEFILTSLIVIVVGVFLFRWLLDTDNKESNAVYAAHMTAEDLKIAGTIHGRKIVKTVALAAKASSTGYKVIQEEQRQELAKIGKTFEEEKRERYRSRVNSANELYQPIISELENKVANNLKRLSELEAKSGLDL